MHKLIEYVCDELEKLEQQVSDNKKLSLAEVEYADKLAHLKKNLLRSDEIMDKGYSGEMRRSPSTYRDGRSYARDGSSYARESREGGSYGRESREGSSYERGGSSYDDRGRDSRGRYSTGRGYSRYVRDDYSLAQDEIVMDLRNLMSQAPDDRMRQEIQRIVTKAEKMDD